MDRLLQNASLGVNALHIVLDSIGSPSQAPMRIGARGTISPDKYPLRQYPVDAPDPELRHILQLSRHQNPPFINPEFMDPSHP
jgi:hypothetical protein